MILLQRTWKDTDITRTLRVLLKDKDPLVVMRAVHATGATKYIQENSLIPDLLKLLPSND